MLVVQHPLTDGPESVLSRTISKPWNSTTFGIHTENFVSIAPFIEITNCEQMPLVIRNKNFKIFFGDTSEPTDLVFNRFPILFLGKRAEARRYLSHGAVIRNNIRTEGINLPTGINCIKCFALFARSFGFLCILGMRVRRFFGIHWRSTSIDFGV